MRELADRDVITRFMNRLGRASRSGGRVWLTGGATAVLMGWRSSTLDVDLRLSTDAEELLRELPAIKDELRVNVELASPPDFIPELPGWSDRSVFITREGGVEFYHYDFYGQALAKIERGHVKDIADVEAMIDRGLVDRSRALELFDRIEPELYRYPAIDPATFRSQVEAALGGGD